MVETSKDSEKRPHILIIDDEPVIASVARFAFVNAGFRASEAFGGAEGLRQAIEQQPDIVLCDWSMPDLNGDEVLKKLKQAKVKTRFILMTGQARELRDTVQFVKMGACDVLHKPILIPEMIATVNRALALDGTLASESALMARLESIFTETEEAQTDLQKTRKKLDETRVELDEAKQEVSDLKLLHQRQVAVTRFLSLAVSVGVTLLFYRLGMIQGNYALLILPSLLFILLSLPFDRIKTFILNKAKAEATFK